MPFEFAAPTHNAIPIWFATKETWDEVGEAFAAPAVAFAAAAGFEPSPGACQLLPDAQGGLAAVVFGIESADAQDRDPMLPGKLAGALPAGTYRFANAPHDAKSCGARLSARALSIYALP